MSDKRSHYCLHWDELLQRLGIPGDARKVWVEQDGDYLHILTDDPNGKTYARGGYVEISPLPQGQFDLSNESTPKEKHSGIHA